MHTCNALKIGSWHNLSGDKLTNLLFCGLNFFDKMLSTFLLFCGARGGNLDFEGFHCTGWV